MKIILDGSEVKLTALKGGYRSVPVIDQIEQIKKITTNYITSHGFITIGQIKNIASKSGSKILKSSIKAAIDQMINSGTIEAITHRWNGKKSIRLVFPETSSVNDVDAETLAAHFECVTELVMRHINVNGFITPGILSRIFTTSRRIDKKFIPLVYLDQMINKLIADGRIKKIDHSWNGRVSARLVLP